MNPMSDVKALDYSCTLSLDSFRKRMCSMVKVESDKPMMKYLVAQFLGGKDISSAKEGLVSGRVLRRSCVIVGLVHLTAQCAAQSSLRFSQQS